MKISGALKQLIKKIESGRLVSKSNHPQNYDKAMAIIEKRKSVQKV